MAVEMVVCNATFSGHTEYNDHCKQVHGINTSAIFRQAPDAPSAPMLEATPDVSGIQGMVEGLTHVRPVQRV